MSRKGLFAWTVESYSYLLAELLVADLGFFLEGLAGGNVRVRRRVVARKQRTDDEKKNGSLSSSTGLSHAKEIVGVFSDNVERVLMRLRSTLILLRNQATDSYLVKQ
ncbi:hypothetical protein R1flu_019262 [Riccia fluitans]|uniref:Uncharacterized protein n=1 Tax=Riccia fluitans TaxID=41844 RepID=A0ABD1ZI59_9MARC